MNRWVINRAGFINFWYYDDEKFDFSDGKLLLRGSNGSGKSVTMQSIIPLLLDGNKSPERLDPFNSRSRKIENYILGDEDSGKDDSIGYIYIEFIKKETQNYITVGMGIRAQRGKSVQSWGFAITDGRRIGKDIFLYKDIGEKVPLTRRELENRIKDGGRVCDGNEDYMKTVNDLLFGFDNIEDYDELVKLLVQIRTPKLSKDFKPSVIYEILNNSIPQLTDDDLRPMSEAIENMDNVKTRIDQLKEGKREGEKLKKNYDEYNQIVLLEKGKNYIRTFNELKNLEEEMKNIKNEISKAEKEHIDAEEKIKSLEEMEKVMKEKKASLENNDSVKIKEKISFIENELKSEEEEQVKKQSQYDKKKNEHRKIEVKIKDNEDEKEKLLERLSCILEEMDELSEVCIFEEQEFLKQEFLKDVDSKYNFSFTKDKIKNYAIKLEKAVDLSKDYEKIKIEYDNLLKKLDDAKRDKESSEKRLTEARQYLIQIKEEYIEKVLEWEKQNVELEFSEDNKKGILRSINNFEKESSADDILSGVRKIYNDKDKMLQKSCNNYTTNRENILNEIGELKAELNEWKNKREPQPKREIEVLNNRKRLDDAGISYIPFYKAVDFKHDFPLEKRGMIEKALLNMGILDALIIPEKYKDVIFEMDKDMSDVYIFPSPKFLSHNLSEIFDVEKRVLPEEISMIYVEDCLKTILIDEDAASAYINEKGQYGIGPLKGRPQIDIEGKFIGFAAREKYRQDKIDEISFKIDEREVTIKKVEEDIKNAEKRILKLEEEYKSFPEVEDIIACFQQIRECEYKYDIRVKNFEEALENEKKSFNDMDNSKRALYEVVKNISLKVESSVYKEALDAARDYNEKLLEIGSTHIRYLSKIELILKYNDEIEKIDEDMDNILYDLGKIKGSIRRNKDIINNLSEQLKKSNYEEIEQEISSCIDFLNEFPKKLAEESRISQSGKTKSESLKNNEGKLKLKINKWEKLSKIFEEAFINDYKLGYVSSSETTDAYKSAFEIVNVCDGVIKKNKDDITNELYKKFTECTQYMSEYILKINNIFQSNIEDEDEDIKKASETSRRLNITGKVRGREVSYYDVIEFINETIEENEKLLKEKDRILFEDVLAKNISKKIRGKINSSKEWVKKMNDLMESMDTSSGLSFSLKWASKKADVEGQLDTKELVELLSRDAQLLKEEDLNKLSEHFRSKINDARKRMDDDKSFMSFHAAIKDVLDYRKWYEFKLFYVKTGERQRELTDYYFNQFSGGEKAMAAYVPLFAAVYARYENARKDCPRIISLDEAFAGVDENNIKDMFRLLNELKLDYIINSQVLWGDYETVPNLSICELVRPNNSKVVTVIRYIWNGKVRSLINDFEEAAADENFHKES